MTALQLLTAWGLMCWQGAAAPPQGAPGEPPPQASRPDPAVVFAEMDENQDGFLTTYEVPYNKRRLFREFLVHADKNRDKRIDRDEFLQGLAENHPGHPAGDSQAAGMGNALDSRLIKVLDLNGDRMLSTRELAVAGKSLKQLDVDGDGVLSEAELYGPKAVPSEAPKPTGPEQFLAKVKEADANGDGKISADECPPSLQLVFSIVDGDSDGFLDAREMQAAMAAANLFIPKK
ncbi:MAG: hypothetical protein K1X74_03410 [Pirellulales bacterium]|nr:hypothetical protein [Pirellulales bacterium]